MFKKRIRTHHRISQKPQMVQEEILNKFLETKPKSSKAALYIHVPYCDNICSFCSLNRSKLDGELDEYCEFLIKEIEKYSSFPYIKAKIFSSVYFGGGTPTVFKTHHLEQILSFINKNFNLSKDCEFSLESTLHSLNIDKLTCLKDHGVNRFSIGIQTFSDKGRKLLNRIGDGKTARKKLEIIKNNFDGLICTDIIYNYPNQSLEEVLNDAKISKDLQLDSVSFYSLMFQEGSKLSKAMKEDDYYDLNHDKALHHAFLGEMLKGNYELLELTKVNKINGDNYNYMKLTHQGADILALGVGAGGKLGDFNTMNIKHNDKIMKFVTRQNEDGALFKKIDALFQLDSINLKNLENLLGKDLYKKILKELLKARDKGLANIKDEKFNLNFDGIFWGNTLSAHILDIIVKEKAI